MIVNSADEMEAMGQRLATVLRIGDIVTLEGPLGAGKTTLARGIVAGLGYGHDVTSPSFAIVHSYAPPETSLPVAHIDFYRLKDLAECDELGLDEMAQDGVMIVEWPDKGPEWIRCNALAISIEFEGHDARRVTVCPRGVWEDRWQLI